MRDRRQRGHVGDSEARMVKVKPTRDEEVINDAVSFARG